MFNYLSICLHSLCRLDRLSELSIIPSLRKLLARSVYFPNVLAQSTNVANSFPVEYTGRYFHRCLAGFSGVSGEPPMFSCVPDNEPGWLCFGETLMEAFQKAGYSLLMNMEGYLLDFIPQMATAECASRFNRTLKSQLTFEELLGNLEQTDWAQRRFAAFLQPYNTHRPWGLEDGHYFQLRGMEMMDLDKIPGTVEAARLLAIHEPDNLASIRRLGLAKLDRKLGRLIDVLDKKGLWSRTVVVVYSNHGEVFDHFRHVKRLKYSCVSHGDVMMFEPLTNVFQAWVVPGQEPGVRPDRVRVIDIFATVRELFSLPLTPGDGASILPLLPKRPPTVREVRDSLCLSPRAYSFHHQLYKLYSCFTDESYYQNALFDLAWDSDEYENLWETKEYEGVRQNLSNAVMELFNSRQ